MEWELKDEIAMAEELLSKWNQLPKDEVIIGEADIVEVGQAHCAMLSYQAGTYLVHQILCLTKRNRILESAVVVDSTPATVFVDRIIIAEPLQTVGTQSVAPLLCEDSWLRHELDRGDSWWEVFSRELLGKMKHWKRQPQFLFSAAKAARGRGESLGAVSGGLPTLGKRR